MTPGNGARDPLDEWLDRGIQPLQPPDGAFETISRRARNRKMGKLSMAASCAASVVVTAALVVPSLLAPPAATPFAAASQGTDHTTGSAPSESPSPSTPTGAASRETPAPSSTSTKPIRDATGSMNGSYPVGGQVPNNFQPTSVTFIGQETGWAIGQGGTPGSCANSNPSICTSVVLTQDGGQTWRGVPAPDTNGVSGIRFLNGPHGWAYGPELWSTDDYGHTWQLVDTHGMVVTDLETSDGRAFAVFATCSTTTNDPSITFYGTERCTDFTLETTPAGSDSWTPITTTGAKGSATSLNLIFTGLAAITSPTIVLQGGTGWYVGPLGQVYTGALTSSTWTAAASSPCPGTLLPVVGSRVAGSAMLDWSLATGDLIMACNGQQSTTIYSSTDGGVKWSKQATASGFGQADSLTASPAAPDILATTQGIVALNAKGQSQEVATLSGGFSYVGMTTDDQGVAVPNDASLHQVWMTYNGGLSWAPHSILP
jgi:hypothetical protein